MSRQFDDELTTPLVVSVQFGDEGLLASDSFSKLSPKHKTDEVIRVATIPGSPVKMAFVHSLFADSVADAEEKGSYVCLSAHDSKYQIAGDPAVCCLKFNGRANAAKMLLGVVAVKYLETDPKTGKFPVGTPPATQFEIGWVSMSRSAYRTISRLATEDGEEVSDFDFLIAAKGKEVGYSYTRVARSARYAADPMMKQAVLDAAAPYLDGVVLQKRLGRIISAEEFDAIELLKKGNTAYKGGE